jgi:HEAT repeat protein
MERPRSKRSTWLAVALLGVPLVGGAGALALRRAAGPTPAVAGVGARRSAPFAVGEQRRWKLALEAGILQRGPHGEAPVSTSVTGEWVVTVVDDRADGYDVACEVASPRVTGGGVPNVAAADVAALERRLGGRFFATYRADGAALEVHFPRELDAGARNLLQAIVSGTQLVRPATPAPQWTAVERDGPGTYLASYHEAAPGHIVKNKLKYLSVDAPAGAPATAPGRSGIEIGLQASERKLTLDPAGELVAFEGGDTVRLAVPLSEDGLTMRVSVRLSDVTRSRAPALAGALARARAAGEVESTGLVTYSPSDEQLTAQNDARLLDGARLAAILQAVRDTPAEAHPREQLEAWVRQRPEGLASVVAATRAAAPGPVTKAFASALGRAGTPASQAALVELGGDARLPVALRSDALVGLMLVKAPSRPTLDAIAPLVADGDQTVRRAALFAGGTLARSARARDAAGAEKIDAALVGAFRGAKDASARAELLGAIGNSAGPTLLPVVREALDEDPETKVRTAAVRALRLYEDAEVKDQLARLMTADREPVVRATAIFAAGFAFDARYVEPLTQAALKDPTEMVRIDATNMLASHQDVTPEIADTLARIAEKDPKPGIRKLARAALAQHATR